MEDAVTYNQAISSSKHDRLLLLPTGYDWSRELDPSADYFHPEGKTCRKKAHDKVTAVCVLSLGAFIRGAVVVLYSWGQPTGKPSAWTGADGAIGACLLSGLGLCPTGQPPERSS